MQLVKTVRQKDGRLQQKLVVSLGQKFVPENLRKTVAVHVENRLNGYQPLYPLALEEAEWVDYILQRYGNAVPETPASKRSGSDFEQEKSFPKIVNGVLLDKLGHENSTLLGPLLALEQIWKDLGLTEFLTAQNFTISQINAAKNLSLNNG